MLVQNVSSDSYRKTKWKVLPAEGCQVYHRGYQKGQEEDRRNSLEYKKNIQWREKLSACSRRTLSSPTKS